MLLGYGIIAIPTGIVTSEIVRAGSHARPVSSQACPSCAAEGHDTDALHCKYCGHVL
jgi:voltage-gated potassium channel